MIDPKTLARSMEAEARWKIEYERLVARFGDQAPERATAATTDSGLPIKPCYFPHDVAQIPFETPRRGPTRSPAAISPRIISSCSGPTNR